MLLAELPRVSLAHLPTPIDELSSLSRALGGPRLFMERDDCTGLATGGMLGKKLTGSDAWIVGISDGEPRDELAALVLGVAREGAAVLGSPLEFAAEDVTIYDEHFGEGYAVPTDEMVRAVRSVARSEGILLDPVYTGKAMAGLFDLIEKGAFGKEQSVLFLHTGGTPALFAYRDSFAGR